MDIQRALDMRALDMTWNKIAQEMGVSLSTLRYNTDLVETPRRHYGAIEQQTLEQVRRMRADGLPWAAIECTTGYSSKHLQRLLREKTC